MITPDRPRRWRERGASLTSYTLTLAMFVVVSIGAVEGLTASSTTYLDDTGDSIGEPRPTKEELGVTQLTPAGGHETSTTPGAPTYSADYTGQFVPVHTQGSGSDKCVQPSSSSNQVTLGPCNGSPDQVIDVFTNDVTGTDQIRIDGKCLGLENDSTTNGDKVFVETCIDGDETQLWEAISGDRWRNVHSGKCLDVEGSGGEGANLLQYDCHGGDNQKFSEVGPYVPPSSAVLSVNAADVTPSGTFQIDGDGNLWAPHGSGNSYDTPGNGSATFTFTVAEAGEYKISGDVFADSGGNNSFWVTNSINSTQSAWGMPTSSNWQNDFANSSNGSGPDVVLTIPANTTVDITIWKREDGTKLKSLTLVKVN